MSSREGHHSKARSREHAGASTGPAQSPHPGKGKATREGRRDTSDKREREGHRQDKKERRERSDRKHREHSKRRSGSSRPKSGHGRSTSELPLPDPSHREGDEHYKRRVVPEGSPIKLRSKSVGSFRTGGVTGRSAGGGAMFAEDGLVASYPTTARSGMSNFSRTVPLNETYNPSNAAKYPFYHPARERRTHYRICHGWDDPGYRKRLGVPKTLPARLIDTFHGPRPVTAASYKDPRLATVTSETFVDPVRADDYEPMETYHRRGVGEFTTFLRAAIIKNVNLKAVGHQQ